jgi:TonB family protein
MQTPAGLQRMVAVSVAAHVVCAAGLLMAPARFLGRDAEAPRTVMMISLGGGAAADSGGMTQIGGRAVQVQTPPEETRREAVRPPAAKTPEMVLPRPGAKPTRSTAPNVKQAPDEARGRTPTRGAQTSAGTAIAETGVRGQGFGLSTGGQGFSGTLDVADFCCPEYIQTMLQRVRGVWQQNQGVEAETTVRFTIQRDGSITGITVDRRSGNTALDLAAQRAVVMTRQLPPLPDAFPNPTLTVNLIFQYHR